MATASKQAPTSSGERIETYLDQAPGAFAAVADSFDEFAQRLDATGAPIDLRAQGLLALADAMSRPETTAALVNLVSHLDALAQMSAVLEQVPGGLAATADSIDEAAAAAARKGARLDVAGDRVTKTVDATIQVLGSKDLDEGPEKIGLIGLVRALRDPDVQRTVALAIRIARAVGKTLAPQNKTQEMTRER